MLPSYENHRYRVDLLHLLVIKSDIYYNNKKGLILAFSPLRSYILAEVPICLCCVYVYLYRKRGVGFDVEFRRQRIEIKSRYRHTIRIYTVHQSTTIVLLLFFFKYDLPSKFV